jgi:hypothetical protein
LATFPLLWQHSPFKTAVYGPINGSFTAFTHVF